MARTKPNVFIININPENWEECVQGHIFGLRRGARHAVFRKGDLFLVRRTGRDYGVTGVWLFSKEEEVTDLAIVPWTDAEYTLVQWFAPLVDFQTPISEEFSGVSKFSAKIQINAMRIVGSVVQLRQPEIIRYLNAILHEKAEECSIEVDYQGSKRKVADVLNEIVAYYREEVAPTISAPEKRVRGTTVGEPINFRGMVYAPLNEAGVVLLFSKVMDDLGIIYESSPPSGFDMVGRVQTDKGFELKHFEFEYRSSNFRTHEHEASDVDYLVCWKHDWPDCPKSIEVVELRHLIAELPARFA